MTKSFLKSQLQSGDGSWLLDRPLRRDQQPRRINSFLLDRIGVPRSASILPCAIDPVLAKCLQESRQERALAEPHPKSTTMKSALPLSLHEYLQPLHDTPLASECVSVLSGPRNKCATSTLDQPAIKLQEANDADSVAMGGATLPTTVPHHLKNKGALAKKAPAAEARVDANEPHSPANASQTEIRSKLASLGCKVSEPVKVEPSRSNRASPRKLRSLPPRGILCAPSANLTQAQNVSNDAEKSKSQNQGHKGQAIQSVRKYNDGKNHDPPKKLPRSTRWPKNKDIPKGDSKRWAPKWTSSTSSAGSGGWLNDEGVVGAGGARLSDDNVDGLQDWAGEWQPPPVDWDSRPAFRDGQSTVQIESWLEIVDRAMKVTDRSIIKFAAHNSGEDTDTITADVAPRYWIPLQIGAQSRMLFWKSSLQCKEPSPLDPNDLDNVNPWWDTYQQIDSNFLDEYTPPSIAGIDAQEEDEWQRAARENDLGSTHATEKRRQIEKAKLEKRNRRKHKSTR